MLTQAQARPLIQERFGIAATGEGALLVVETPPDRWQEFGRFARDMFWRLPEAAARGVPIIGYAAPSS